MRILATLAFLKQLLYTSLKASMSLRGAFFIESGLMIANNLIFFSLWWIFFRQFHDIEGWQLPELTLLMAIGMGAYGLMQILFGGVRPLSKMIINGDLDSFMVQPKNLLLHLLCSRSNGKGWGHLMTTITLIAIEGLYAPKMLGLIAFGIVCSCLVFTASGVIAHSLAFWLGPIESLSHKYLDSLFLFALYPTNIYSGLLKLLMFTVIPAGIIGYLPIELIRNFSWTNAALLALSSLFFAGLAFVVFYAGLKKYESGNQFSLR